MDASGPWTLGSGRLPGIHSALCHVTSECSCLECPALLSHAVVVLPLRSLLFLAPRSLFSPPSATALTGTACLWLEDSRHSLPQCREASGELGCSQQPPQACRQMQLGQSLQVTSSQTQQRMSALALPNKLDNSFTSSCRVLLALMRWQLPPLRMRKQDH